MQFLRHAPILAQRVKAVFTGHEAVVLRVPNTLSWLLYKQLRMKSFPFAVEVVGNPYDNFSPQAVATLFVH